MNCLKCGREITTGTFCEDCLFIMSKYPVKPNTVVMIPKRPPAVKHAAHHRKEPTDKELLQNARLVIRRLTIVCIVMVLLLAGSIIFYVYSNVPSQGLPLGQNYTAITDSQAAESTSDVSRETSEDVNR